MKVALAVLTAALSLPYITAYDDYFHSNDLYARIAHEQDLYDRGLSWDEIYTRDLYDEHLDSRDILEDLLYARDPNPEPDARPWVGAGAAARAAKKPGDGDGRITGQSATHVVVCPPDADPACGDLQFKQGGKSYCTVNNEYEHNDNYTYRKNCGGCKCEERTESNTPAPLPEKSSSGPLGKAKDSLKNLFGKGGKGGTTN